uniref:ATP synthase F0 subunit 8 n=1 Tax=Metatropis longirostris TaxID=2021940 RepID=A0A343ISE2_9HEMI|nr:ATP synthase F0 subunit 8 [Metatropis longirostris]AST10167.1 ATP synthase F0 subunit 8 [Metatropis longirostris]
MPQMAPMWWELLFMMFMMSYLLMNMIMFWNNENKINKTLMNKKMNTEINWKF